VKTLLCGFSANVGREDIFKPTIGNESSHEISNGNGVRVVYFASSKNLVVGNKMLSHRNVHKYTDNSHEGDTQPD
jgi:hypothetical protein